MGFLNGLVKRKAHTRKVGTKTVKVKAATKGSIDTSRHKKATTKRREVLSVVNCNRSLRSHNVIQNF